MEQVGRHAWCMTGGVALSKREWLEEGEWLLLALAPTYLYTATFLQALDELFLGTLTWLAMLLFFLFNKDIPILCHLLTILRMSEDDIML